jgi:hypothetical protein
MFAIIIESLRRDVFARSAFVWAFGMLAAAFVTVGTMQVLNGSVAVTIMIYGLRTYLLHLPLPFIMAKVIDREDLKRMCRLCCIFAIVMTPIVVLQFESSPDAWINRGTMGDIDLWGQAQQIVSVTGKIRAAGTFSYNLGVTFFYGFAFAIAMTNELMEGFLPKALTRFVIIGTILVVALSGSRTAVSEIVMVLAAFMGFMLTNPRLMLRGALGAFAVISSIVLLLLCSALFRSGLDVLETRFSEAAAVESNDSTNSDSDLAFLGRVRSGIVDTLSAAVETPLIGRGLGLGTNVGSKLSTGAFEFLLAEDEWPRVVMECGPILGVVYLAIRIALACWLITKSVLLGYRRGSCLAMLVCSSCAYNLVFGQWGPPTTLGLAVFVSGVAMTALNIEPRVAAFEANSNDRVRRTRSHHLGRLRQNRY